MHHRSPQHSKHPQSSDIHISKSAQLEDAVDMNLERSYLSKLRTQREKIQKLYLSYEQSTANANRVIEQNNILKERLIALEERLQIEEEHKQLVNRYQTLESINSELQLENQELRVRYEQKFLQNNRKLKQLKEYYGQEHQEFEIELNMVKDINKELESRLEELKMLVGKMKIQADQKEKGIENLKKEYSELVMSNKRETNEFRNILNERDQEHKKLKAEMAAVKQKYHEQSYFIELEKQKYEEMMNEYNGAISKQKMQVQSLERELLAQLQENNKHIETQQKYLAIAKESKSKYQAMNIELQTQRNNEKDWKDKINFKHKQEKRRLEERVELLEEEVRTGNKQFSLLVGKYERLQSLMKRREMNENAKRELIRYQHQEIDKMDLIFKL